MIEVNDDTRASARKMAEEIQGTCGSLDDLAHVYFGVDGFTDLPVELLEEIDDIVFQCAGCGWWCEISEASEGDGEDVCIECAGED